MGILSGIFKSRDRHILEKTINNICPCKENSGRAGLFMDNEPKKIF